MTAVTKDLSDFVSKITYDKLPKDLTERVKALVFDTVGIMVRARHDAESTAPMLKSAEKLGLNSGHYTVIGDAAGYSALGATMVNGTLAHSLDFDDTHASGSLHPSAPIVSAAFTAAEMTGANGKDLIAAIVAGYETQIRLALALDPAAHYDRGFHPSATCGAFGAAAACARLMKLDTDKTMNAFGIVLSMSAGSMQFLVNGAWTKRSHIGHAAMCGLIAATQAGEGYKGASEALEGKWGFLHAYAPESQPSRVTEALGRRWETMKIAIKPYPSCRYTHAAIDGIAALRKEHGLRAEDIQDVAIGLPEPGFKITGDPESAKQSPKNVVDGQFSMPFCAAVAIKTGGLVWDDYAKYLGNAEILALCKKVQTRVDPKAQADFPEEMAASVRVTTKSATLDTYVRVPKGEPKNFLTPAELMAKFEGLVAPYLSKSRRDELADTLLTLEQSKDIGAVLRLTRAETANAELAVA